MLLELKQLLLQLSFKHGIAFGCIIITAFILACQFVMWYLALAIIISCTPLAIQYTLNLLKRNYVLAVYFVFIALQSIHMCEHIAQMVQIHVLGRLSANSHGLFGAALDVEWLHFAFDSLLIPIVSIYLIYKRRDLFMILMLPITIVHCCEHIVIMDEYLRNGLVGNPGIFASGGLIGSPLTRPDLHFMYNLVETTLMLIGFRKAIAS